MKSPLASFCSRFIFLISLWAIVSCNQDSYKKSNSIEVSEFTHAEQLKNHGNCDSAIIFYRKAAGSELKFNHYPEWIKSVVGLVDCLRIKGDLDEAMRIVDQAQEIAKTEIDTSGNYYSLLIHKKATLFSDKRQFEQAARLYSRNIKLYLSMPSGQDTGLALSYNGMGTLYLLQNLYTNSLEEFNKALEVYQKVQHTKSPNYASTIQNIGIVYSKIGNYENAEKYFLKSLSINQQVLEPNDPKLASLYLNLGRFYLIMRNDSKALEYMTLAEKSYASQNQSNSIMAGLLFLNIGGKYIYTADYEKAQSYLNKSLEIISSKAPNNRADILTIYLNMGFIAEKKGEYNSAKNYYLKGLSVGDKLDNSMKVLRGLANVSYKMKDIKSADYYYKSAIQRSIEMYGKEHPETALSYLRYGDFLSATGNNQALFYLEKSLTLYENVFGPVNIDVSTAYYIMGNYYYRIKNYTKAINSFQHSLVAGFPGFTSLNFADNPKISKENLNDNLLNPVTAKATALLLLYQSDSTRSDLLKSSASCFNIALKMIETLRSTYQDEDSKLFISGNEKNTFSNALLSEVKLFQKTGENDALEQAFSLSEKSKSAVLLAHLRDEDAKSIGRIPKNLLASDASLKSEIYFYNKQVHDEKLAVKPDETKIKLWNSRIFDLSRKQDELIKSIEKNYPVYYNLKFDNSVISIGHVQKKLSASQSLIEYTMTDSVLYSFAVSSGKQQLAITKIDTAFRNDLQRLRQILSGQEFNNYSGSDFRTFIHASHDLYSKLLLPLKSVIKGKELIIIPDGELGYLSFDVLLTSLPDSTKPHYKNLPYLIRESAISYAPSATTFFDELNLKNGENNGRILALAPDYGNKNTVLDQKDENGNLLRKVLINLTSAQEEIRTLEKYFNVKPFIGEEATETAFKQNASGYRILHLAMHTLINNENPLYSKLIFFKPKGDTAEDGMLNASELINMQLHADMAVLSACNTGAGKMSKGEGIMSLSRDFFYAGVPGIIMTSWAVEDRSGVKLMEFFYKYLAQGKPRHEALRLAKIEYLDNCDKLTSHPHYWASYMNVGDISPLEGFGRKASPFFIYGVTAFLFFSALILLWYLHVKQQSKKTGSKA
ncbi:MAG: CHAT domain-containing tetratricopeptide repeat protein [Bacteroidota bacterium]